VEQSEDGYGYGDAVVEEGSEKVLFYLLEGGLREFYGCNEA